MPLVAENWLTLLNLTPMLMLAVLDLELLLCPRLDELLMCTHLCLELDL